MKIVIVLSVVAVLVNFIGDLVGLSQKITFLLPVIYLGASFYIVDQLNIGYRIFHHISVVGLVLYYIFGLVLNGRDVLFGSGLESMLAYSWFYGVSIAYIFFCIMFAISYAPYGIYIKVRNKKNA